jgi:hypothetical protein
MHRLLLLVPISLAACATAAPSDSEIPVRGESPGYSCRSGAYEEFIGQVATSEVGARLLRASGARTIRWVQPGMQVTMDYRTDRLTVRLASNNRIVTASCG